MWPADRVAGLAIVAAGLFMVYVSLGIGLGGGRATTLSARFMPLLLSSALIVLGSLLILRPSSQPISVVMGAFSDGRTLLFAALLLVYYLSFRYVDFRVGAWLFVLLSMVALGSRRPAELIVVPVVTAAAIYSVFRFGFGVLLPIWI